MVTSANVDDRRADIIGGLTTFVTMAYIVVVNPAILSGSGTGMPLTGVLTATVLVACTMTPGSSFFGRIGDMPDHKALPCGCAVETYRDFLGRVVGKVVSRHANCQDPMHVPGSVVIMPGRENARPE